MLKMLNFSASGASNSNAATIAGSVIGSIGVLLLCILASWLGLCRRKRYLAVALNDLPSTQVHFSCNSLKYIAMS
jgi:fumarate reductase subunit D